MHKKKRNLLDYIKVGESYKNLILKALLRVEQVKAPKWDSSYMPIERQYETQTTMALKLSSDATILTPYLGS